MLVDPKVLYWTGAWLNMAVIVTLARIAIGRVRRGEVLGHRHLMLVVCTLVVAFLVSYAIKLGVLGREELETWHLAYVLVLRFHEACIAAMVLGGATALHLAHQLRLRIRRDGSEGTYPPDQIPRRLQLHQRAGKTAFWSCVLGLLSSGVVLFGMWQRALTP